ISLAFALAVALARHRSPARQDLLAALGLAAAAAGLGAASRRWAPVAIAGAVAAPLAVALATGAAGPVAGSLGAECVATEGACAVAAAAGALGGAAALEITCAAHAALPHLLAFHVGGVAAAAALAAVIYGLRER